MRAFLVSTALLLMSSPAFAQDAAVAVDASQNGQNVELAQGASLQIKLSVNPSTGAHWDVMEKPDFLGDPVTTIAAPTLAPGQRPRLGAPQMATTTFGATGSGSGDVVMELHGPVAGSAATQIFRITVTAQ